MSSICPQSNCSRGETEGAEEAAIYPATHRGQKCYYPAGGLHRHLFSKQTADCEKSKKLETIPAYKCTAHKWTTVNCIIAPQQTIPSEIKKLKMLLGLQQCL